jgi:hypothetical protein
LLLLPASQASVGVAQPFDAVHNPYTIDYSTAENSFGVPSARIVLTQVTLHKIIQSQRYTNDPMIYFVHMIPTQ